MEKSVGTARKIIRTQWNYLFAEEKYARRRRRRLSRLRFT